MKCIECDEYKVCSIGSDLRRKRARCPKAKQEPKPITNYDRIIRKTPEELAEWISSGILNLTGGSFKMANKAWLDWLRQEAAP